ncbi:MAG: aldolase/citrate lyase family protein [Clostridiales bacterium]|nr:aldolase/citrate lyase family protein [Clostridiales bacterium]
MYQNAFKEKLKDPNEVCTMVQMKGNCDFAEMAGRAGFDAILLDCEHSELSMSDVKAFVRAAQCGGAEVLIRAWKNDPDLVARYLDTGAAGILFIDIRTKEDAIRAVESVKYAPWGKRGLSGSRANNYGFGITLGQHVQEANDATIVALMIESRESIENLEEIASVPGVDLFCLGPTDLSCDLGHPGESRHPEVAEWESRAYEIAAKAGIPMDSIFRPGSMDIEEEMARGRRVMTLSLTSMVADGYRQFIRGCSRRKTAKKAASGDILYIK